MSVVLRKNWFIESKTSKIKLDYDFVAEIGQGVSSRVFKALHKETGTHRAIKIFIKANHAQVESFKSEIAILRTIDHPNIVNTIETYEDEQFLYLVLEYCSGGNIVQRISRDGTFSEHQASKIMRQLFSALIYCHKHSIMHLDLKHENCMYTSDSTESDVKLIDFGLSSLVPSENEILNDIRGTPFFIAPEVLSKQYNCKADCWSAGVVLYFILSGQYPFNGRNTQEVLYSVYDGTVSFRDPIFKNISNEAKDLISRLLVKNIPNRLSAEQAYNHPWVQWSNKATPIPLPANVIENITRFVNGKEMKQAALMYIACKLTESDLNSLKEIFRALDTDGDGMINVEDMQRALNNNTSIPEKRLEVIVSGIDVNRNGIIDYTEFITACMGRQNYRNIALAKSAFKNFDRDSDGFITADELRQALFQSDEFNFEVNSRLENMIIDADSNGDGKIDYMEFLALLSMQSMQSCYHLG